MASIVRLFLAGDVMTGRGIDQVLAQPSDPRLYEPYVRDARDYVQLAERANGPIPRRVEPDYIWGDALETLDRAQPDARLVNLETSVTVSDDAWPSKGIHYRMHPGNVECLTAARLDCCVLANNHVLDFGRGGLVETLATLRAAGLGTAGAGLDAEAAAAPCAIDVARNQRVLVFGFGSETSGIPLGWAADGEHPGVNALAALSGAEAVRIADSVGRVRRPGDVVVASIHWGGNWGYEIPDGQRELAHALIDAGAADVVHGHSSHHAKGIEVYRGRPVLYGCGDFIADYEGIGGREHYRSELALMYFVDMDAADGSLASIEVAPFRVERFRLNRASSGDLMWLSDMLNREGAALGARAEIASGDRLVLRWR